jgi:RNA polymerase sigma-70 factor (ECF subfamily)
MSALLTSAVAGDERAFGALVEPYRGELHAHCYRMLGSLHDAEDALQDTLLRAWRALGRFEGRSSLRSWLYKIATNICLDVLARRPTRMLPIERGPATDMHLDPTEPLLESVWIEPYPDTQLDYEQREGVELAFIAALQHLPATQRAVLVLREVLGFSARETAETLETTVASVNSALQRARAAVEERTPERSQQETLQALGDDAIRELVERYVDAWERADVDAVVAMLAEDATFAMPPLPEWYAGREAIRTFLPRGPLRMRRRFLRAHANGQLAFGTYREEAGRMIGNAVHVITLRGPEIAAVDCFIDTSLFPAFGLPLEVE